MKAEPDIRAVLGQLHGVASRPELAAAGVSEAQLRRHLRSGVLVPVRRGAYALPELVAAVAGDPAREHALAAAAVIRPGAAAGAAVGTGADSGAGLVASHQSAAIIHGLDLLALPDPAVVTLTRSPHGRRSRSDRAGAVVHIADLPPGQVTTRHGVRVTTVARTVIDLARLLPFADGVVTADAALHGRKTGRGDLTAVLASCARWPGTRRAELVTAFSDHRAESALESVARVAFHQHGLPAPRLQAWVGNAEGVIGRADFFWPEHRTIAEADGALKYASPQRAVSQLGRDGLLREGGFEVVHFTWHEIMKAPGQVVALIKAAFERGDAGRDRDRGSPAGR